ncbi:unnamed protein product [Caenorhabditis bovis]|uniref:HAP1 N-terminal domain-containing protein n=1 Tax=Caenorhabditis bovis TaxID=2654633 RepID=A0A8S1F0M1_9PELO|nr:unnamed protein product [Caenorhabditis bovis]
MQMLEQKDRDLEYVAKIGQSLLEQNKDLQTKNEFLEESVSKNLETIIQLKHELNQRIELLRVYSNLDDDGLPRSNSDETIRERLKFTKSENERLKREYEKLKQDAQSLVSERNRSLCLEKQLDEANEKITSLQKLIEKKTQELSHQQTTTCELVRELADKEKKEKILNSEKNEMSEVLIEMIQKHDTMMNEVKIMQEQYAELMINFSETEAELTRLRQNALRISFDSLYDSLASEMENSESGINMSIKATPTAEIISENLPPITRIEKQTATENPHEETPTVSSRPVIECDASTSCTDLFAQVNECSPSPSFHNLETSTPKISRKLTPKTSLHARLQKFYIDSKPPCSSSTSASLEDYSAPKLGQPGIPGSRDLTVSLKMIKAREEVQKEFAAFCQRRGVEETEFFGNSNTSRRESSDALWTDHSYASRMLHLLRPNRVEEPLSVTTKRGVLTRAELLGSPSTSPQHHVNANLLSLSINSVPNIQFGATNGVLQRRS